VPHAWLDFTPFSIEGDLASCSRDTLFVPPPSPPICGPILRSCLHSILTEVGWSAALRRAGTLRPSAEPRLSEGGPGGVGARVDDALLRAWRPDPCFCRGLRKRNDLRWTEVFY